MLKKYAKVTVKGDFYIPQDRTPERNIEDIVRSIEALGGKEVKLVGNKLTNEIPS